MIYLLYEPHAPRRQQPHSLEISPTLRDAATILTDQGATMLDATSRTLRVDYQGRTGDLEALLHNTKPLCVFPVDEWRWMRTAVQLAHAASIPHEQADRALALTLVHYLRTGKTTTTLAQAIVDALAPYRQAGITLTGEPKGYSSTFTNATPTTYLGHTFK